MVRILAKEDAGTCKALRMAHQLHPQLRKQAVQRRFCGRPDRRSRAALFVHERLFLAYQRLAAKRLFSLRLWCMSAKRKKPKKE